MQGFFSRRLPRHAWRTPCGAPINSNITLPLVNLTNDVVPNMTFVIENANQLAEIFDNHRGMRILRNLGDNLSQYIEGLPSPSDIRNGMAVHNRTEHLVLDYLIISTYVVFGEQIIVDETVLNPDNYSMSILSKWRRIEQKILDLLCVFQSSIISRGSHIASHVNSDVMADCVRSSNCGRRESNLTNYHIRDYIVLLSLRSVFRRLQQKYSSP